MPGNFYPQTPICPPDGKQRNLVYRVLGARFGGDVQLSCFFPFPFLGSWPENGLSWVVYFPFVAGFLGCYFTWRYLWGRLGFYLSYIVLVKTAGGWPQKAIFSFTNEGKALDIFCPF